MNHTPSKHGVYFLELELENVRCFGPKVKIDLRDSKDPSKPARWTVLVGENGVGKTTVLRSLVSVGPFHAQAESIPSDEKTIYLPIGRRFVSLWSPERNESKPTIAFLLGSFDSLENGGEFGLSNNFSILTPRTSLINFSEYNNLPEPGGNTIFTVLGYGASRHMSSKTIEDDQLNQISLSLFDDTTQLTNASELFHQTYITSQKEGDLGLHETLKSIILSVLPNISDIRTSKGSGFSWRAEVQTPYGWVWIHDLSLGYKTMVSWIVDFASKLFLLYPNSPNPLAEPAVCLVDEIDLHMHPTWQRKIMGFLTSTFPNTQFIVTAHSPLMVQAAAEANVVLLTREGDHVVVNNEPQIVKNWSVDQILASVFGISGRTEATEKNMERRRELLGKSARTPEEQLELEQLEVDLEGYSSLKSSEELEAASLIREFADIIKRKKQSAADDQNP